jgi:hypothetical protein
VGNTLETPVASRNGCSIRKSGVSVSQCAGSSGLLTIQKRDKNPTLNREVLCAKMRARNENQLPPQRPTQAWDGSPTGCHNPAGRYNGIPRPLVCVAAGERRKGDRERRRLYLYSRSAISRSTAHDETRRRHLCYCSNE